MEKIILSVRLTENFFSKEEMSDIKAILKTYNSKSEFIRDIIKLHLNNKDKLISKKSKTPDYNNKQLVEIKNMLQENKEILKEIKSKNFSAKKTSEKKRKRDTKQIYKGQQQKEKTDQILSLLDQF